MEFFDMPNHTLCRKKVNCQLNYCQILRICALKKTCEWHIISKKGKPSIKLLLNNGDMSTKKAFKNFHGVN